MAEYTQRQLLLNRWGQLKSERSEWIAHWQELSRFLLPRNGRFFVQDRNRGFKRHNAIYDSTGTKALRTLAAGLMGGLTSPARPWLRLAVSDHDLNKQQSVKVWLAEVTQLLLDIFAESNTYRALHQGYTELGCFGTWADIVGEDYDTIIHHTPLTAGEYAIGTDMKGNVCTLYREFERTVSQVVKEFGRDSCSLAVKNLYDRGALDAWVPLMHAIEPRGDRDPSQRDGKNMAWSSCYFEPGAEETQTLREGGYRRFPVLAPRWDTAGGDIYGSAPAMDALGDVKQLQHQQLRKGEGIDYQTRPPLQAPASFKGKEVEMLPGGLTFVDMATPNAKIQSAFDVNLNMQHLLEDIQDVRGRINSTFFADLFLMLDNNTDQRMTATEVAERHEEKMLILGPVLERLFNELLAPLVDITLDRVIQAGVLPPPPPEVHGQKLDFEFVSILAQAQRAIAVNNVDRFVANLGQIATFKPGVLDKFDEDRWADEYSDMMGVSPDLIVADDKVAIVRKERAQANQAAQQAAMANSAADTANKLGNTPTQGGGSNLLTALSQGAGTTLARGAQSPASPLAGLTGYQ